MSHIKKIMPALFFVLGLLSTAGCGDPNSNAVFNPDRGTHPAGWLPSGHAAPAMADANSCAECHGSDLSGGIATVSCSQCHLKGSPNTFTECTSCHGKPPTGTVAPDRSGAHAVHNALPNVATVCNTCHNAAGAGTLNHDNDVVDLNLQTLYSAKSGLAVLNEDGTCSKVSCHGGQTTPVWSSGTTIDVNTQCTSCHSYGTSEYNSFVSGKHDKHVNERRLPCEVCHSASELALTHFTMLNTPEMEGPASATISGSRITNYTNGFCTPTCHAPRNW